MPFLAPIGIALGASAASAAAVGTLATIGTGLAVGGLATSLIGSSEQASQTKKATEAAANQQAAAQAALTDAQNTASSQAQAALTAKRSAAAGSQDVFTSPLGITTQANTARKTLTGQ